MSGISGISGISIDRGGLATIASGLANEPQRFSELRSLIEGQIKTIESNWTGNTSDVTNAEGDFQRIERALLGMEESLSSISSTLSGVSQGFNETHY